MKNHTPHIMAVIGLAALAALLSGCVQVKHATVTDSTFNTAGWKSQAASGSSEQAIDATNDVAATNEQP